MEDTLPTTARSVRIPRIAWTVGASLLVPLIAITVFNVPLNTVMYYGFIILMIAGHFFMHGSHGGQASHGQSNNASANADGSDDSAQAKDKHSGHSGGCH